MSKKYVYLQEYVHSTQILDAWQGFLQELGKLGVPNDVNVLDYAANYMLWYRDTHRDEIQQGIEKYNKKLEEGSLLGKKKGRLKQQERKQNKEGGGENKGVIGGLNDSVDSLESDTLHETYETHETHETNLVKDGSDSLLYSPSTSHTNNTDTNNTTPLLHSDSNINSNYSNTNTYINGDECNSNSSEYIVPNEHILSIEEKEEEGESGMYSDTQNIDTDTDTHTQTHTLTPTAAKFVNDTNISLEISQYECGSTLTSTSTSALLSCLIDVPSEVSSMSLEQTKLPAIVEIDVVDTAQETESSEEERKRVIEDVGFIVDDIFGLVVNHINKDLANKAVKSVVDEVLAISTGKIIEKKKAADILRFKQISRELVDQVIELTLNQIDKNKKAKAINEEVEVIVNEMLDLTEAEILNHQRELQKAKTDQMATELMGEILDLMQQTIQDKEKVEKMEQTAAITIITTTTTPTAVVDDDGRQEIASTQPPSTDILTTSSECQDEEISRNTTEATPTAQESLVFVVSSSDVHSNNFTIDTKTPLVSTQNDIQSDSISTDTLSTETTLTTTTTTNTDTLVTTASPRNETTIITTQETETFLNSNSNNTTPTTPRRSNLESEENSVESPPVTNVESPVSQKLFSIPLLPLKIALQTNGGNSTPQTDPVAQKPINNRGFEVHEINSESRNSDILIPNDVKSEPNNTQSNVIYPMEYEISDDSILSHLSSSPESISSSINSGSSHENITWLRPRRASTSDLFTPREGVVSMWTVVDSENGLKSPNPLPNSELTTNENDNESENSIDNMDNNEMKSPHTPKAHNVEDVILSPIAPISISSQPTQNSDPDLRSLDLEEMIVSPKRSSTPRSISTTQLPSKRAGRKSSKSEQDILRVFSFPTHSIEDPPWKIEPDTEEYIMYNDLPANLSLAQRIQRSSLDKLLYLLLRPNNYEDNTFLRTFLITYPSFVTSEVLLTKIKQIWNSFPSASSSSTNPIEIPTNPINTTPPNNFLPLPSSNVANDSIMRRPRSSSFSNLKLLSDSQSNAASSNANGSNNNNESSPTRNRAMSLWRRALTSTKPGVILSSSTPLSLSDGTPLTSLSSDPFAPLDSFIALNLTPHWCVVKFLKVWIEKYLFLWKDQKFFDNLQDFVSNTIGKWNMSAAAMLSPLIDQSKQKSNSLSIDINNSNSTNNTNTNHNVPHSHPSISPRYSLTRSPSLTSLPPLSSSPTSSLSPLGSAIASKPVIPSVSFLRFKSEEIAQQLTLQDWEIFQAIKPFEWLSVGGAKTVYLSQSPNISKLTVRFNKLSGACFSLVLGAVRLRDRIKVLEKLISLTNHLYTLRSFHSMMSILGTLNHSSVARLKYTWQAISKKHQNWFAELTLVMDSKFNFRNYRDTLLSVTATPSSQPNTSLENNLKSSGSLNNTATNNTPPSNNANTLSTSNSSIYSSYCNNTPATIPFIGLLLTDLTFIEDGNPNTYPSHPHAKSSSSPSLKSPEFLSHSLPTHRLINFNKRRLLANVMFQLEKFQLCTTPYSSTIVHSPNIQNTIAELPVTSETDSELFARSLLLEPRDSKPDEIR